MPWVRGAAEGREAGGSGAASRRGGRPRPRCRALGARPEDKGAGLRREPSPSPPLTLSAYAACQGPSIDIQEGIAKAAIAFQIDGLIFSVEAPAISTPPRCLPFAACHSCDPSHPGQPKVGSQARCSCTHMGKVAKAEPCCDDEAPTDSAPRLSLSVWTFPRCPWGDRSDSRWLGYSVMGLCGQPLSFTLLRASKAQAYGVTEVWSLGSGRVQRAS